VNGKRALKTSRSLPLNGGMIVMALSKKGLDRRKSGLKAKLVELEAKVRMDPLKKNRRLHEDFEEVKHKLSELV